MSLQDSRATRTGDFAFQTGNTTHSCTNFSKTQIVVSPSTWNPGSTRKVNDRWLFSPADDELIVKEVAVAFAHLMKFWNMNIAFDEPSKVVDNIKILRADVMGSLVESGFKNLKKTFARSINVIWNDLRPEMKK